MSDELENKTEGLSSEQDKTPGDSSHENHPRRDYSSQYRTSGRSPRPRISSQRSYPPRHEGHSGGAFRPEGFGGLQSADDEQPEGGYRQRGSYQQRGYNRGGYRQHDDYRQRSYNQGGYRPRYTDNESGESGESGEQPRHGGYRQQGGYQPRGGYRPRYNNGEGSEDGYRPRSQGEYRPRTSYRPRYTAGEGGEKSEGGEQLRQEGYRPRQDGYQQRQGGYRQGGGYRPRSYGQDGYRQGGYRQRSDGQDGYRQGGYRQRSDDYSPNAKYSMKKRIEYNESHIDPTVPIRLNKYLANAGICSRREADEFIQAGVVSVNGKVVTELGTKVMRTDVVKFHDDTVSLEKKVYVLLNKPKDCVTTSDDPQHRRTVMELVKDACPERIYPVGRLDRNTTGVLLLTNDGDLASKLTHPKFLKKKIYQVTLDKNVTAHDLQQITEGITLEDGEVRADAAEYAHPTDKNVVGIEIHSGKNRIVRRIFESLGYRVIKLDRVLFAGLTKKNLRRGDWRFLTEKEVDILRMGAFE